MTHPVLEQNVILSSPVTNEEYVGLGGWLILVAIGLIMTPLRLGVLLFTTFVPLMSDGTWEALTTPGTETYHPLWGPLLTFEILGNLFFLLAALVLLMFYFSKSRVFPRLMVGFYLLNVLFIIGDSMLGEMIPMVAQADDPESTAEVARAILASAIWVPYFFVSKRVKATFVR